MRPIKAQPRFACQSLNLRRAPDSGYAMPRKLAIRCAGGEFTVHQVGVDFQIIDSDKRPL
jgi:hypothetical protein